MRKEAKIGKKILKTNLNYQKLCENVVYVPKKHYLCT